MYSLVLIIVMTVVVVFLRAVPFLLFRGKETPKIIAYLGHYLPYAVMGMLLVYCLKDTNPLEGSHGLPELIAILVTVGFQVKWKKGLYSIIAGTIIYMIMVQTVFL